MSQSTDQRQKRRIRWKPASGRMGAVLPFPSQVRRARAEAASSDDDRRRLDALRRLARRSSLARRPACLIGCGVGVRKARDCGEFCAAEQFRAFVEIADRRVALYQPGAQAVSADEEWLLRLTAALSDGDVSSATALVAFRVDRPRRRQALAMAGTIAACLSAVAETQG